MKEESMKVIIDFKLPSNEILLFTKENIILTERSAVKGILTGSPYPSNEKSFRKHRYSVGQTPKELSLVI